MSITHPGVCPDEVLMMPNWFVVLEGFPVVFHGFPVVDDQEKRSCLELWSRNIKIISRYFDPGVSQQWELINFCLFLF